jgi:hypothetical protein
MSAQPWKHALFLKGKDFMWELEDVSDAWTVNFADLDKLDTDGFYEDKCLVELTRSEA